MDLRDSPVYNNLPTHMRSRIEEFRERNEQLRARSPRHGSSEGNWNQRVTSPTRQFDDRPSLVGINQPRPSSPRGGYGNKPFGQSLSGSPISSTSPRYNINQNIRPTSPRSGYNNYEQRPSSPRSGYTPPVVHSNNYEQRPSSPRSGYTPPVVNSNYEQRPSSPRQGGNYMSSPGYGHQQVPFSGQTSPSYMSNRPLSPPLGSPQYGRQVVSPYRSPIYHGSIHDPPKPVNVPQNPYNDQLANRFGNYPTSPSQYYSTANAVNDHYGMSVSYGQPQTSNTSSTNRERSYSKTKPKISSDQSDVVFKFLDANGSGDLSIDESLKLLALAGLRPDPIKYENYFRRAAGPKGQLSFDGFCRLISESDSHGLFPDLSDYIRTIFDLIDTDHTLSISPKELLHIFHSIGRTMNIQQAEELVAKYDRDGNNSIEFNEFKSLMSHLDMLDLIVFICAHRVKGELVEEEGDGQTKSLDPNQPTAIVVLGKKLDPDGNPTDILKVRMAKAIHVMQSLVNHPNDVMIVTGGKVGGGGSEADVMRDLVLGKYGYTFEKQLPGSQEKFTYRFGGIPQQRIVLEDKAQTTIENAFLVRQTLEQLGIRQVIIVTSDFHMARSREVFKRILGMDLTKEKIQGLQRVPIDVHSIRPGRVEYNVFYEEDHPPLDSVTRAKELTFETFVMPHVGQDIDTLLSGKKVLRNNKP